MNSQDLRKDALAILLPTNKVSPPVASLNGAAAEDEMADLPRMGGDLFQILMNLPAVPKNWKRTYLQSVIDRATNRVKTMVDRVNGVTSGRKMPAPENVAIGSGKQFRMAVMFLDISGFTEWRSSTFEDQKRILYVLDVFMAEMMNIVRDHDGEFEKNTGDGILAYFGTDQAPGEEAVRSAVECAVLMHFVNDELISPWLTQHGLWPVDFRIGIDFGATTIAKIGIHGTNAFVAVGTTANVANRLLRSVPRGIAIGNNVYTRLPKGWGAKCKALPANTGYEYAATRMPYPVWELTHRLTGWPVV